MNQPAAGVFLSRSFLTAPRDHRFRSFSFDREVRASPRNTLEYFSSNYREYKKRWTGFPDRKERSCTPKARFPPRCERSGACLAVAGSIGSTHTDHSESSPMLTNSDTHRLGSVSVVTPGVSTMQATVGEFKNSRENCISNHRDTFIDDASINQRFLIGSK